MAGDHNAPVRPGEERTFDEPWQARIFAMVNAMHGAGHYDWRAFQELLIDEIASHGSADGHDYYERWLAAAERLIIARGFGDRKELAIIRQHLENHPPPRTTSTAAPLAVEPARRRQ
ncbi:MAG: nitrile hydratase accessory protein [Alphaproteobacteria bacterium]|nr:nitrile hydratase accessory protein [Alphaproteobacteria bacterium]